MRFLILALFAATRCLAQNFTWGHSPPPVAPGGIIIVNVTTNFLITTGSSLSTTIPATAAGNCLVLCMENYHSHASSCTTNGVSAGAAFQIATNAYIGSGGSFSYVEGYFIKNVGAGITTVNVGITADGANSGYMMMLIMEVSGLSTTAPYTATERIAGINGGYNAVSTQDTGGQISNGTANSIFFGVCTSDGANVITTINASGTDGTWIEPPNTRSTGIANAQEGSTVYQIVSSSSARKHVWNRVNNGSSTMAIEFVLHQ